MTSTETYAYWRAALQAKDKRSLPSTSDGDVHCGRYRMRKHKDGPWVPVAVWPLEGHDYPACRIDGYDVDFETAQAKASFFHQNPVTQAQYAEYEETGRWWDEVGLGHNNPPDDIADQNDLARLQAEFEALEKEAAPLIAAKIETQDQADRLGALANALTKIKTGADKLRKAKKQPHLDAGKAVDDKWNPLKNAAEDQVKKIQAASTAYLKRIREEREAEVRRLEEEARTANDFDTVKEKIIEAQQVQSARVNVGSSGRGIGLKEVVEAEIVDFDKALNDPHIKNDRELRDLVRKLATRAVRAGIDVAGVERATREEAA